MILLGASPNRPAPSPASGRASTSPEEISPGWHDINTSARTPFSAWKEDLKVGTRQQSSSRPRSTEKNVHFHSPTSPAARMPADVERLLHATDEEVEREYFSRFSHSLPRRTVTVNSASTSEVPIDHRVSDALIQDTSTESDLDSEPHASDYGWENQYRTSRPPRFPTDTRTPVDNGREMLAQSVFHSSHPPQHGNTTRTGGEKGLVSDEIDEIEDKIRALRARQQYEAERTFQQHYRPESVLSTSPSPASSTVHHRSPLGDSDGIHRQPYSGMKMDPPPPMPASYSPLEEWETVRVESSISRPRPPSRAAPFRLPTYVPHNSGEPEIEAVLEVGAGEFPDMDFRPSSPPQVRQLTSFFRDLVITEDGEIFRPGDAMSSVKKVASPYPGEQVERALHFTRDGAVGDISPLSATHHTVPTTAAAGSGTPSPLKNILLRTTPPHTQQQRSGASSTEARTPLFSLSPFIKVGRSSERHTSRDEDATAAKQQDNASQKTDPVVVEVELAPGQVVEVAIHPGDTAEGLARSFIHDQSLDASDPTVLHVLTLFFRQYATSENIEGDITATEESTVGDRLAEPAKPLEASTSHVEQARRTEALAAQQQRLSLSLSSSSSSLMLHKHTSARSSRTATPRGHSSRHPSRAPSVEVRAMEDLPAAQAAVEPWEVKPTRASLLRARANAARQAALQQERRKQIAAEFFDPYADAAPGAVKRRSRSRSAAPEAANVSHGRTNSLSVPRSTSTTKPKLTAPRQMVGSQPPTRRRSAAPVLSSEEREVAAHCSFKPAISRTSRRMFVALQERGAPLTPTPVATAKSTATATPIEAVTPTERSAMSLERTMRSGGRRTSSLPVKNREELLSPHEANLDGRTPDVKRRGATSTTRSQARSPRVEDRLLQMGERTRERLFRQYEAANSAVKAQRGGSANNGAGYSPFSGR